MLDFLNPIKTFSKFEQFDEVQRFRLQNSYAMALILSLISPTIVVLKGTYMLAWIIGMFSIVNMLSIKTNQYFVDNFNLDSIYKLSVISHLTLIFTTFTYFFNPIIMIWLESIVLIADVAIFSSYSIMLNNYLTKYTPNDMKSFQIVRNSSWADASLIGLFISTGFTMCCELDLIISFFIICNILMSIWFLKNWNFYSSYKY